ncbi:MULTISPECIES: hypothetical protein [Yersinia]|uniref:hypothetical protein n=1 Tax=Yersinia TaxID=629 RepID=UPI000C153606|nr:MULTISPECIES: hypothetical protein [Yersinia]PHZ22216.1 hypothetical protein CS535_18105 [Yersinia massiliensis]QDW34265.1 hypothetical protein FFE93_015160 [Yersinia sp. KBS0713]
MSTFPHNGSQGNLVLTPTVEVIADGIPMGVLSDGTPYLTLYGLAKLCGIDEAPLRMFTSNWDAEKNKPRGQKVAAYLAEKGYFNVDRLYTRVINSSNVETHAYPDYVCMAIMRYYAMDATNFDRSVAVGNFVRLAEYTLKRMIYEKANYNPNASVDISFDNYRARIKLNDQIPSSHFAVFREIADVAMNLIGGGFPMDDTTSLDGSVGNYWGRYWSANNLSATYGERIQHPHTYPDNYRQSAANKHITAWIYPIESLGIFRKWLHDNYAMEKLPRYLETKNISNAVALLDSLKRPEIPHKH